MATSVSSALLSSSAAALDRWGSSSSPSPAAGSAVSLLPSTGHTVISSRSLKTSRLAARATADRSNGVLSGEWDTSISLLSFQDLTLYFQDLIASGLDADKEEPAVPLRADASHGVVSGEWDQTFSHQTYEDLTAHLMEAMMAPPPPVVQPLMADSSHGVISGEWDQTVTLQSYDDVLYHLKSKASAE
eukprot:TRINITY_DN5150_c0_g1_i1.p1 TRINITY_DN5150_c0_g1~~TRINITY_DN5150_c0_g1_i1.p1  ORF type:complete len:188 (+),score=15.82 TRINITY_DN5150_c0_g1_i1:245-808(+)